MTVQTQVKQSIKQYAVFLGIVRKEAPKWKGWKLIDHYKKIGIRPPEIQDDTLDVLVENFYLLKTVRHIISVERHNLTKINSFNDLKSAKNSAS